MKTLQNDFTTPEQSKRLLELGVPADSADMLWDGCVYPTDGWEFDDFPTYSDKPFSYYQSLYRHRYSDAVYILPCWSVGRLMEIFMLVQDDEFGDNYMGFTTDECIHNLVDTLMEYFADNEGMLDFSKLEE